MVDFFQARVDFTTCARRLIGSRIIESVAYSNQILMAPLYFNQYKKRIGLLDHSVIVINLMLAQSDPIRRRILYYAKK